MEEDSEDDNFLKKVEESDDEIPDDLLNLKLEKVFSTAQRRAKKEMNLETDTDLLKRFYGDAS